jgi:hypothetical protein
MSPCTALDQPNNGSPTTRNAYGSLLWAFAVNPPTNSGKRMSRILTELRWVTPEGTLRWPASRTKLYSRLVGKLLASDDSIPALASSTSLSICRAYLPYLSKMVSEFRTAFLTLVSFENNTVPPSAG